MNIWCVSYSDNHRSYEKVTKVASLHVLVFTVLDFFVFHVYEFVQRSLFIIIVSCYPTAVRQS